MVVSQCLPGGLDWQRLQDRERVDDPDRAYCVLVVDLVGLLPGADGQPDASEFATHLLRRGAAFHDYRGASPDQLLAALGGSATQGSYKRGESASPVEVTRNSELTPGLHFFYQPDLNRSDDLLAVSALGQFDGLIAAATVIPSAARFAEGAVRIGAGTGNMGGQSWGGGDGSGGEAPLMNTPSFNSRATAQMVFKALLGSRPDLNVAELYRRVRLGTFDTGRDLRDYPTCKLEGQRIGVLGFGNIGREVAQLAQAFGMRVAVYARASMRRWIESEGFEYCATVMDAAYAADVLTPHLGLGASTPDGFANTHIIDAQVLSVLAPKSVLINYDRGELVDVSALEDALESGHVAFAAIDADIFLGDAATKQKVSGPLTPYLPLLERHAERVELLPHAAADTDHPSRCAGAKQAADQLIAAIRYRCVANLKGDLPAGYFNLGSCTLPGVGAVNPNALGALVENTQALEELQQTVRLLDEWLQALGANNVAAGAEARSGEVAQRGIYAANTLSTQLAALGLIGSARDL